MANRPLSGENSTTTTTTTTTYIFYNQCILSLNGTTLCAPLPWLTITLLGWQHRDNKATRFLCTPHAMSSSSGSSDDESVVLLALRPAATSPRLQNQDGDGDLQVSSLHPEGHGCDCAPEGLYVFTQVLDIRAAKFQWSDYVGMLQVPEDDDDLDEDSKQFLWSTMETSSCSGFKSGRRCTGLPNQEPPKTLRCHMLASRISSPMRGNRRCSFGKMNWRLTDTS
jgi:hypothetical protein